MVGSMGTQTLDLTIAGEFGFNHEDPIRSVHQAFHVYVEHFGRHPQTIRMTPYQLMSIRQFLAMKGVRSREDVGQFLSADTVFGLPITLESHG